MDEGMEGGQEGGQEGERNRLESKQSRIWRNVEGDGLSGCLVPTPQQDTCSCRR